MIICWETLQVCYQASGCVNQDIDGRAMSVWHIIDGILNVPKTNDIESEFGVSELNKPWFESSR